MTPAELRASRAMLIETLERSISEAEAAEGTPDAEAKHDAFVEAERALAAHDARIDRADAMERARGQYTKLEEEPVVEVEERAVAPSEIHISDVREAATYSQDPYGPSFFKDITLARSGDNVARERLERHNLVARDEYSRLAKATDNPSTRSRYEAQARAVGQTAGGIGEFVFPIWLDAYVPYLRAGRATADQCFIQPFVKTNSINVPKLTTGTTTAVQSSDNTTVSATDLASTSVTAQVQTVAGSATVSRQLYDLDNGPQVDQVVYRDLLAAYNKALDTAVLNGTVTNAKGILQQSSTNAVTYTDASPSGSKIWATIFQAKAQIEKLGFMGPDGIIMHPSSWNWFISSLDSQNRPLALDTTSAVFNAMAQFNDQAQGLVGQVAGIPVYQDANVPVNLGAGSQSPWIMFNRMNMFLYENPPTMLLADQPLATQLSLQYVLYGYYAFTAARLPQLISVINGTGLIVQSGY